jgi:hypothetical protein
VAGERHQTSTAWMLEIYGDLPHRVVREWHENPDLEGGMMEIEW